MIVKSRKYGVQLAELWSGDFRRAGVFLPIRPEEGVFSFLFSFQLWLPRPPISFSRQIYNVQNPHIHINHTNYKYRATENVDEAGK